MKKEDIDITDWARILFGEAEPLYLLEVVVRVAIVYIIILVAIRFMGKRMSSEMSRADMVARVCLAAAVGLPIQRPGRGLLVALVMVIVIVIVGRWIAQLVFYKRGMEKVFQGKHGILVEDGIMNKDLMKTMYLTRERLFAALRKEGIRHLGEVKRLYIEANGAFSLVEEKEPKPGLCIIPDVDADLRDKQQFTTEKVCSSCGRHALEEEKCNCGSSTYEHAL